jgi:hypothetical protein
VKALHGNLAGIGDGVASSKHSLHHWAILSRLLSVQLWLPFDFAQGLDPFDFAQGHPEPVERMSLSKRRPLPR